MYNSNDFYLKKNLADTKNDYASMDAINPSTKNLPGTP